MVASPPPSIAALGGGNPMYGFLSGGGGDASEAEKDGARKGRGMGKSRLRKKIKRHTL
jgi:hypothetical protein